MDAPTRVLMSINHEEPDRVPAFESQIMNNTIIKYHGLPAQESSIKSFNMITRIPLIKRIRFDEKIGKLLVGSMRNTFELYRRVKIDIGAVVTSMFPRYLIRNGFVDEFGRIHKPESYKSDGTFLLNYFGGHFKNFEEYESWDRPDPNNEQRQFMFKEALKIQNEMNNEVFAVPFTIGLMEGVWEGFGMETFSRILVHNKQAQKVFDDLGKFLVELIKVFTDLGAKMFGIFDDWGFKNGLMMNPRYYKKYIIPWLKKVCDTAHQRECKVFLHSDGDLMKLFDDIVGAGVDVLNPIEPTTANPDYDIFKLNKKYGDKITFAGNISTNMLSVGTIFEIKEYSKKLLTELAPGGGYIFASGHSINPTVTTDRWQALLDVREKYGKYPI
ncbi:MAG: hypothetical protein GY870_13395 [archaeon]|nr:hypothetical protein [archaeon]